MRASGGSLVALTLLSILLVTCGPAEPVLRSTPTAIAGNVPRPTLAPSVEDIASTGAPTLDAAPRSPIPEATVQVTALGNVYVRRGPDLAFNAVGILSKGEVVTASGRDVLSDWVRITLPRGETTVGWISIMSDFTAVSGPVEALPEIEPQEWPQLASVRNCTPHELWIDPAGLTLPPVSEFPNNELVLNPGVYSILDVDVDGYPQVIEIDLAEGDSIDVIVDGLGEKKVCPRP